MSKRILFTVLNWGLGHATRSMPLIDKYREEGAAITIVGSGKSLYFLQERFPDLNFIDLFEKELIYGKRNTACVWLRISWYMFLNFRKERKYIKTLKISDFDLIISDNRYGFYHSQIYSIFISHQYRIRLPRTFRLFKKLLWMFSDKLIHNFDEFWIPDEKGIKSLSGALSQTCTFEKAKFIGYLSRFSTAVTKSEKNYKKYDVLLILSGLEPQRSILLNLLAQKMEILGKKMLVIGGRQKENPVESINLYDYIWHLNDVDFAKAVREIPYIISRSGYSTIMDLSILQRKALLIPTPNQAEQEYLAEFVAQKFSFIFCRQKDIEKWTKLPTFGNLN